MIYILVPYRNREKHLEIFTKYTKYLLDCNKIEAQIYICHQDNDDLFNKGLLLNYSISFLLIQKIINENDTIIINDVDCLCPENKLDSYIKDPKDTIRHIYGYTHLFHDIFYCLGGVFSFKPGTFIKMNGFPNNFNGWGAEDLALGFRANLTKTIIDNSETVVVGNDNFFQLENPTNEPTIFTKLNNNSKNLSILIDECKNPKLILDNGINSAIKIPKIKQFRDYIMLSF